MPWLELAGRKELGSVEDAIARVADLLERGVESRLQLVEVAECVEGNDEPVSAPERARPAKDCRGRGFGA
jgi:hypothetical protein